MIDYSVLKKIKSQHYRDAEFRAFLDFVAEKWYVECELTNQGGSVKKIFRNRYGIPVCLQIISSDGKKDMISVDNVTFYEPWDNYVRYFDEYEDNPVDLDEGCDEQ